MPINEPAEGRRKSQIEEYLDWHNDNFGRAALGLADRRRVGIRCTNSRRRGVNFLKVPQSYYDEVWKRVEALGWNVKEDHEKIADLGILVDADDEGYLLQLFTQPLQDRPTLFFEIICRRGSQSLREGQLQSLASKPSEPRAGSSGQPLIHPDPPSITPLAPGPFQARMTVPGSKSGDQSRPSLWRLWSEGTSVVTGRLLARRSRSIGGSCQRHWAFVVSNLSMVGKSMGLGAIPTWGHRGLGRWRHLSSSSCWLRRPFVTSRSRSMDHHACVNARWAMAFEFWSPLVLASRAGRSGASPRALHPRDHRGEVEVGEVAPVSSSRPRCWWPLDEPRGHAAVHRKRPPAQPYSSHDPAGVGRSAA